MMTDLLFARHGMRLVLPERVQRAIWDAGADVFPLETAGALFGVYTSSREVGGGGVLDTAIATEAQVACRRPGPYTCETDAALMQRLCDERWPRTYYLGTWHTHPGALPTPSKTDLDTLLTHAADPKQNCPEQLLVILGGALLDEPWSVHVTKGGVVYELKRVDDPAACETIALFGAGGVTLGVEPAQAFLMAKVVAR